MWIRILIELTCLILLMKGYLSLGAECPSRWFDCNNGKCISDLWLCDGDNDCGNFKDEHNCENHLTTNLCPSTQFKCQSDKHCIPETWHCDGEKDCEDGSDEMHCDSLNKNCNGFRCRNHHCIPSEWKCDKKLDCTDGSDEELCSADALCTDFEFICSSGACLNRSLICDGKKDCADGSDEGQNCDNPCETLSCSQKCKRTPSGPRCYCEIGYILDKDNKTCLDVDECLQQGFCSHECTNTVGGFKCSCLEGYELVDRSCKAKGSSPLLILSTMQDIRGIHLRSGEYFLIRKTINKASAVDTDPNSQNIYWIEISNKTSIYSTNLKGSGFRTILSHGLLVPEDISVDYIANNLYLTDSGLRLVLACKMDGTMCHVLHNKKIEKPRSIELDLVEGFLYWSDWGEQAVGIYRSGMDGSRRISLVSSRIVRPSDIAIDHTTNRLYWADEKLKTIEYISLDRKSRKVILNAPVFHPHFLAVFEDTIYWTDWMTFSLESCNKFTGHNMTILARENIKHMTGVHIYHPVITAKVPNPCWSNDCSHMCLISPGNGFSCACPLGFTLSVDGKSCTMEENSASLFLSEGSSVFYIRPEAFESETVTELPLSLDTAMITRVAYDKKSRYLFVADVNTPAILAVNMTSLRTRELVRNHIVSPEDLSFDSMNNNLYWIDSSKGTVEVISIDRMQRVTLLTDLKEPVSLVLSPSRGLMFIATVGMQPSVSMYDMNGKNKKILHSVQGLPMSLAHHPSKSLIFWADPRAGTISHINYLIPKSGRIVKSKLGGILSIAASEEYIYWTTKERELNLLKGNETHTLHLPGQDKGTVSRKVSYIYGVPETEKSKCQIANGGCSHICLASPNGKTCACPGDMILAEDDTTCIVRRCEVDDFRCMNNGRCLPVNLRCDGSRDCVDGSDEVGCGNRCSGDDFQCKNGRCILKSWRCDRRNDCADNSDEENCPEAAACAEDQISCSDEECIAMLWRCDGELDCADGSDENNCNATRCDPAIQQRCSNGQCVPISWVCDGANDCYDGSDERNCSEKVQMCYEDEFRCEANGTCIDAMLKCDGRLDCDDGSDEVNCSYTHMKCNKGMYRCDDGICIYENEVCDGHNDCSNNEEEHNCTNTTCQPEEMLCVPMKICVFRRWICDGFADCSDGSDERNCSEHRLQPERQIPRAIASECDEFFCYITGQCISWSKVCNGKQDCEDLPDEGGLCSRSCLGDNGGCSQICRKTPQGSRCDCLKGYKLLGDNKTCDDINECNEPGTCSHFCNNTKGGFKCSCADGYYLQLDHRLCKADGGPATLVYLLGDQIKGFDLYSHAHKVYINMSNADMRGMDYDASEGIFYWTEWNDGSINSFSPDTHRQDILVRLSSRPIYVRYDWIAKNLYYTNANSSIGVCTKDGKFCRTLIQSNKSEHIDSIDLSPTTGEMFWTRWLSERNQESGFIERAEMDGSHRRAIVLHNTLRPTSVTVDHVLKLIYWTDASLNTLECADFHGLERRQIVRYAMFYPYAMAVFEDYVYWADWGTDTIRRCDKFKGKDCPLVREGHVKAHVLLIVHKVTQSKGINRCVDSGCHHLCLLTRSNHVCMCSNEFVGKDDFCEARQPLENTPASVIECPTGHCLDGAECTVKNGEYVCKCPVPYSGKNCEVGVPSRLYSYDYSWIVAVLFAVLVIGMIVLAILLCYSYKSKFKTLGLKRRKGTGRNALRTSNSIENIIRKLKLHSSI